MTAFLVDLKLADRVLEMGEDPARTSPGGSAVVPSAAGPRPNPMSTVPAGLRDLIGAED